MTDKYTNTTEKTEEELKNIQARMTTTLVELKDLNKLNNTLITKIQFTLAQVTELSRQNQELTTSLNVERAKEPLPFGKKGLDKRVYC